MTKTFGRYEIFLIAILAFLQFTIILDFMVLSPLSAVLLTELKISTSQFGMVVSAYAWSAGASGLLAAGFADKFDRKKILLFFYCGFIIGTLLCGIAMDYTFLLVARIVTGIFGGVIGSVVFAIATDLFALEVRGRVMGFLQMSFAGAQVLGLPIGLYLANHSGWHSPFLMIVGFCVVVLVLIIVYLKPVTGHLKLKTDRNPVEHLFKTLTTPRYARGFVATVLLATGGFMLMPFGSAYAVNNLNVSLESLPVLYMITGICSMFFAPMIGKLSDAIGKYTVFCVCSVFMTISVVIYCNIPEMAFWLVVLFSIITFVNVSGRMVSSSALMSAVPGPQDRGAFMSINASISMMAGGVAASIAGMIVYQLPSGDIVNYDILSYVVAASTLASIALMYMIHRMVTAKQVSVKP